MRARKFDERNDSELLVEQRENLPKECVCFAVH